MAEFQKENVLVGAPLVESNAPKQVLCHRGDLLNEQVPHLRISQAQTELPLKPLTCPSSLSSSAASDLLSSARVASSSCGKMAPGSSQAIDVKQSQSACISTCDITECDTSTNSACEPSLCVPVTLASSLITSPLTQQGSAFITNGTPCSLPSALPLRMEYQDNDSNCLVCEDVKTPLAGDEDTNQSAQSPLVLPDEDAVYSDDDEANESFADVADSRLSARKARWNFTQSVFEEDLDEMMEEAAGVVDQQPEEKDEMMEEAAGVTGTTDQETEEKTEVISSLPPLEPLPLDEEQSDWEDDDNVMYEASHDTAAATADGDAMASNGFLTSVIIYTSNGIIGWNRY